MPRNATRDLAGRNDSRVQYVRQCKLLNLQKADNQALNARDDEAEREAALAYEKQIEARNHHVNVDRERLRDYVDLTD